MRLEELPPDVRPREKILNRGPNALSDCELLAFNLNFPHVVFIHAVSFNPRFT